jgi:hypothetical protein
MACDCSDHDNVPTPAAPPTGAPQSSLLGIECAWCSAVIDDVVTHGEVTEFGILCWSCMMDHDPEKGDDAPLWRDEPRWSEG